MQTETVLTEQPKNLFYELRYFVSVWIITSYFQLSPHEIMILIRDVTRIQKDKALN